MSTDIYCIKRDMVTTQSLFFLLDINVISNHLVVLMTTKLFGKLRFLMKLASNTSFSVPKNTPRVFHVETMRNTLGVFVGVSLSCYC